MFAGTDSLEHVIQHRTTILKTYSNGVFYQFWIWNVLSRDEVSFRGRWKLRYFIKTKKIVTYFSLNLNIIP